MSSIGIAAILSVQFLGLKPVILQGRSMYPTLQSNHVYIMKKHPHEINRGDIVVYDPLNFDLPYTKRVIAVSRDKLTFMIERAEKEKKGKKEKFFAGLVVNDKWKYEIAFPYYIQTPKKVQEGRTILKEFKIPQNCYYVLGDNLQGSYDSRDLGPIMKEQIIGKLLKNRSVSKK